MLLQHAKQLEARADKAPSAPQPSAGRARASRGGRGAAPSAAPPPTAGSGRLQQRGPAAAASTVKGVGGAGGEQSGGGGSASLERLGSAELRALATRKRQEATALLELSLIHI